MKIGGDGRVFHASGNLRDQFGKKPEDLRNKTVLSFDRKQIQEIQITKERQTTVFKRQPASAQDQQDQATPKKQVSSKDQQPVWMADKGDRVDVARIERFLATLDKLTCDGYLEGHKKSEFLEPVFEVRLKDPKTVYRLALFAPLDKKKEAHPGVSTQNDFVFFLEKWQADKVMLSPGELMEKAAAVEKQIP